MSRLQGDMPEPELMMRWIAAAVFCCLCTGAGRAGQINWSCAFGSTNQTSAGSVMSGQMVFELGVFAAGFTPTAANAGAWAANWRRAALAFYNVDSRHFTGVHPVTSNAAPFLAGTKGYIWGHDGNCTDGEWILLSAAGWVWPSENPLELPVNWTVSAATQVTVGLANGMGFAMKSAKVSGQLPVTTWLEWRAKMFNDDQLANVTVSGPNADPDGDGVVNVAEFALGGHPLIAGGTHGRVAPGLALSGGRNRLTMTISKRCDRSINWSAQASLDLLTWSAGATVILQNTAEVLEVMENHASSEHTRVFLRPVFQVP
jgi:hypothetical protein